MSEEDDVFDEDLVRELGLDPEDLNGPKLNKKKRGEPAPQPARPQVPPPKPRGQVEAPAPNVPPRPQAPQQQAAPQPKTAPQTLATGAQIEEQALRVSRDIPVQLAAVLAKRSLKLQNILEYQQGDVIEFKKQPHELLDLVANGKLIAKAELVMIDGNLGARIVKLIK